MDGYQLLASILQSITSLAWPAALFGSVWLFREKLTDLLPFLRVKHKEWEVSFRLDQAEKEAATLPSSPAAPEAIPTPEEQSKFEQIAEISPRAAILEVRSDIEEAVGSVAKSTGLLTPKVQSLLGLTRFLRSREVIDRQTSALLDDLRVLGNNAAHSPDTGFTKEEALRYRSLANQVITQLRLIETNPISP
jgi:hypothetical protein